MEVEVIATDVTDEEQVEALATRAIDRLGQLDVFVANAGIAAAGVTD